MFYFGRFCIVGFCFVGTEIIDLKLMHITFQVALLPIILVRRPPQGVKASMLKVAVIPSSNKILVV